MASDLTQDTVLYFLQNNGGTVKNADLVTHFKHFIRDHVDQDRNRELFKKFINTVATVKQIDGVRYVILRKKFRGNVPGGGGGGGVEVGASLSPRLPRTAGKNPKRHPENPSVSPPVNTRNRQQKQTPAPAGEAVLTAAGIIANNNNDVETNLNLKQKQKVKSASEPSGRPPTGVSQISNKTELRTPPQPEPPASDQRFGVGQQRLGSGPPLGVTPVLPAYHRETSQQVVAPEPLRGREAHVQPKGGLCQQVVAPEPLGGREAHVQPEGGLRQQVVVPEPLGGREAHVQPEGGLRQQVVAPEPLGGREAHVQPEGGLRQQVVAPEPLRGREAHVQPKGGLHQEPPLHRTSLHPQVRARRARHRQSYKSAVSCDEDEEEEQEIPLRTHPAEGVRPLNSPLYETGEVISGFSPYYTDVPAAPSALVSSSHSSWDRKPPKILSPQGPGPSLETGLGMRGQLVGPGLEPNPVPVEFFPTRRTQPAAADHHMPYLSQDTEAELYRNIHQDHRLSQLAGVQLEPNHGFNQGQKMLSSSHSSIFSPPSVGSFPNSNWSSPGSPRYSEWYSSSEDLQARAGERAGVVKIQEVLDRAHSQRLKYEPHHGGVPWHHSTGHLCEDQEPGARLSPLHRSNDHLHINQNPDARTIQWQLSTDSLRDDCEREEPSESPAPRLRPSASKRLSSRLRSRMCRSLGTDLDQLLQEEQARGGGTGSNEAARLSRLHRISSSLSLRYNLSSSSLSSCSTPPRCQSLADLVEGKVGKEGGMDFPTITHHEAHYKQSLVPLEAKEHAWLVKCAAGSWTDIYSLFREDSSLLNRQDFISGFTVLHWIAKHGDHRVLNTLWYGVEKVGMTFDVNAKSTSGHTPLHIAAIHCNKNIIRLLVNKFKANVKLRDIAGKKPWQYLNATVSVDIFQLLGAPARAAVTGEGGLGSVDPSWARKSHRRHPRHHLSTASGARPLTILSAAKVKRSTSIAALFKHKSKHRLQSHLSDSSV